MKTKGSFITGAFVSLLVITLVLCNGMRGAMAADVSRVKVGVNVGLTGPGSPYGIAEANGLKMVFDSVNNSGGIKSMGGAKIDYELVDHQTKVPVSTALAEKLVKDCVLLVGTGSSGTALASTTVAERAGIPHVICGPLDDSITSRGYKYTFKIRPQMETYSQVSAEVIKEGQAQGKISPRIAIMQGNNPTGQSGGKGFTKHSNRLGLNVVSIIDYPIDTKDFSSIVLQMKEKGVNVVAGQFYPAALSTLIKNMAELKYNPTVFLDIGAGNQSVFIKDVGRLSEGVMLSSEMLQDQKATLKISERYKAIYNMDLDGVSAAAVTAGAVIVKALETAGSVKPDRIREALLKIQIQEGDSWFPYRGSVKFDETGQNTGLSILVGQVQNLQPVTIYPEVAKTANAIWKKPTWQQ